MSDASLSFSGLTYGMTAFQYQLDGLTAELALLGAFTKVLPSHILLGSHDCWKRLIGVCTLN